MPLSSARPPLAKIIVDGRYTYVTDQPVKVGDVVVLPTPDWLRDVKGPTFEGRVTALGSDYDGPCRQIIAVLPSPDGE